MCSSDLDSNEYLFATIKKGDTYYDYMICVPESYFGSDEIQNKINYTYTEGAEDSGPLRIRGFLRRSFEELDNTAKETYPLYANLEENEDADPEHHGRTAPAARTRPQTLGCPQLPGHRRRVRPAHHASAGQQRRRPHSHARGFVSASEVPGLSGGQTTKTGDVI